MATTTTRVSTKGQVILPKAIRDARAWGPGTELEIENTKAGVLLKPKKRLFPPTKIDDVAGILKYKGKPKTIREMDESIAMEVKRRHALGRY
jgi:AbrB family looped-hinge helix DNA binding protein